MYDPTIYNPEFWHRIRTMENLLRAAPSWIEKFENHELELLLRAVEYHEHKFKIERATLLMSNPREVVDGIEFPEEVRAATLRAAVTAEIERRASGLADRPRRKATEPAGELPELSELLENPDTLPDLLRRLVKRQGQKELFDENGFIGNPTRSAAPLFGLADGWRQSRQIRPNYDERDVYVVLCRTYGVPPTPEPWKTRTTQVFKDVSGWVRSFYLK